MNAGYFIRKQLVNYGMEMLNLFPDSLLLQNKKFKNIHQGKRCFILGSGHSILTQDLTKMKNDIVITQNHFHAHKDIGAINPAYHIVVPKFHPAEYDKDWIDWIKSMEEKLPSSTTLFFGKNTRDIINTKTNLSKRSYYINYGFHSVCLHNAKIDITKRMMNIPTVITQCITIALYMGFSKIYLVGFDLDQLCRMQTRDTIRFYGHSQITKNEAEQKLLDESTSSGYNFFHYWLIWKQLILLYKYAKINKIEILNAANGGILDVYPRVNYDLLF